MQQAHRDTFRVGSITTTGSLPRAQGCSSLESRLDFSFYEQNRHRIYSLAFWMTDHELAAAELTDGVLQQVLLLGGKVSAEVVDRIFLGEIRELMPIGQLTLECAPATEVLNVRRNTMRIYLERAVVQLPPTERLIFLLHDVEGYNHEQIGGLLGMVLEDCISGLHQARLRLRELLVTMIK